MEITLDKNNYMMSKRYARALIELAKSDEELDEFYNNLLYVLEIYKTSDSFKETMNLPSVEKNNKKEVLKGIFKDKINNTVLKFLYVLIDSSRFGALESIIYCIKEEKDKINNILNANITSSTKFSEDMKKNLQEILENKTNKKVNIKYSTDNTLIGGFILKIGERVVDLSLKNKIKQIEKQLT